ncbi:MAG: M20/M25/M40 family metallo-hydrolase, partial [Candidatus Krumholzibacteria bacterium]|nr:M20/M25/M40 family metallo-hydrolase [Candidatus Krumholzibacteria bacterium]
MKIMRIRFTGLLMLAGVILAYGPAQAGTGIDNLLQRDVQTLSSESCEGRGVGTAGLERALDYVEKQFQEAGLRPFGVDGYRQSFAGPDGTTLVNLIGVLGDSAGDQHVIVGAHYDHLGLGEPGDANHGVLHPGADDNASGIAVLLECARRLAEEGELMHPIVFIAFSGEEIGLLGSAHYVEHPAVPLGGCTGMINLDTVGRLFDGPLTVFGANTA